MRELDARLADVPGTVSVWIGPLGGAPRYTREPAATHYAASLMKLPLLAAIDQPRTTEILVHNDFASVASGRFGLERRHDSDDAVWRRLGERVTLGWLAERMITYSSNLAANLILERIGIGPADGAWRQVGARHSTLSRGIGDGAAARVGHTNLVTAADLARLLGSVELDLLFGQRLGDELLAGLPPGTRVAHKNGWIMGVRHVAGVVFPNDSPAFVVCVCMTTPLAINRPDDEACRIVSDITREAWAHRR